MQRDYLYQKIIGDYWTKNKRSINTKMWLKKMLAI